MLRHFEIYFLDIIKGQRKGFVPLLIKAILLPLSWIYQFIVTLRNWAFDHGWLRRYTPPVPIVISIGNIVAGGTGKTPVTSLLAKEFYPSIPLAILSKRLSFQGRKSGDSSRSQQRSRAHASLKFLRR